MDGKNDVQEDAQKTTKTAFVNTMVNVVSMMVGIVMIPVITHILTTEDVGMATTFISTRNTLVSIFTLAIYAYVNKAMLEFKEEKESYLTTIVVFCAATCSLAMLAIYPFRKSFCHLLSLDSFLYYWLFISCFILAVYTAMNSYYAFHNCYMKVALMVFAMGVLSPLLSAGLSKGLSSHKYIGRIIGLDFAYILVAIMVICRILFSFKTKYKKEYILRSLKFTVPIIPHHISQMVLTQCDLIMINYFEGREKTGIYSMGHSIGYLALNLVTQIMMVWSPWVYRRFEEKDLKVIYRDSKSVLLLGTYITMGLLTISTEAVRIFLIKDYLPCIYILPPLVVAMYFQFIYLFLYDVEYYNKKASWIASASVVAAVLNLVLNGVCIPHFGYMAACYTTMASYLVLLLLNYMFCRKLDISKIYDIRFIVIWVLIVILYAVLTIYLKDAILPRYVIFTCLTVLLFVWKYKEIKILLANAKK